MRSRAPPVLARPSRLPSARRSRRAACNSSAITLSGRYLAARVAEQDHDYDTARRADRSGARRRRRTTPSWSTPPSGCACMPGASTRPLSSRRKSWWRGRATACPTSCMAVQSIKKGDYRAAEQQLGRIGGDSQLGPLREYRACVAEGRREGLRRRARARCQAEARGRRARRSAGTGDRRADRRDGRRQGCGGGQVPPRHGARQERPAHDRGRRRRLDAARQGRRGARSPQDLRREVQRRRGDGRPDRSQRADAAATDAGFRHLRDPVRHRRHPVLRPAQCARRPGADLLSARRLPEAGARLRLADGRRPLRAVPDGPQGRRGAEQDRQEFAALLAGPAACCRTRCPAGEVRTGGHAA